MKTGKSKEEKRKSREEWKKAKGEKETKISELIPNVWYSLKYIYRANRSLIWIRGPLMLLQTVNTLIPILFVRQILNEITVGKDMKAVLGYALLMGISIFAVNILNNILGIYDKRQLEKTLYQINRNLGEAVMNIPYDILETPKMKDFVSLAQYNRFNEILMYFTGFIGAVINLLTLSAIIVTINPLILLLLVAVMIFKVNIDKIRRGIYYRWRGEYAPVTRKENYYLNIMHGVECGKEVRANALESWIFGKYEKLMTEEYEPLMRENTKSHLRLDSFIKLSDLVQNALIYLILAFKVVFRGMLIGDFSMYLTSVNSFANSMAGVSGCFSNLMTCGIFAKDFRYCLEETKKIRDTGCHTELPKSDKYTIEFRNVSFRYPNTERMILKNINITLQSGESLSIVGMNGAGKTTFVKLLCRFYVPTEGDIFINGVPVCEIPFEEYRKLLSVVFQDFKLFAFSVDENVQMDTAGDRGRVEAAIRESGLEEKVSTLPHGGDTYVYKQFDPDGIEFSGGEGQKLAIARALYKDTPIVILDEPTSALDPIAEYDVYKHFHDLSDGRTSLYISHRLSSTRFTDKIAVFEDGEIKEYGSHDELMKMPEGIYRKMFRMQAQYYV